MIKDRWNLFFQELDLVFCCLSLRWPYRNPRNYCQPLSIFFNPWKGVPPRDLVEEKSVMINGKNHVTQNGGTCKSSNLIYGVNCKKCDSWYVGETGMRLHERLNQHRHSIGKFRRGESVDKSNDTGLSEHFASEFWGRRSLIHFGERWVEECGGEEMQGEFLHLQIQYSRSIWYEQEGRKFGRSLSKSQRKDLKSWDRLVLDMTVNCLVLSDMTWR